MYYCTSLIMTEQNIIIQIHNCTNVYLKYVHLATVNITYVVYNCYFLHRLVTGCNNNRHLLYTHLVLHIFNMNHSYQLAT